MTNYVIDMAENTGVTVMTETRNLRALPFRPSEDQLSTGKAWEEWLDDIEREFRYFRISSPTDRKDAMIIYGGKEIARLEKSLSDPDDPDGRMNEYVISGITLRRYVPYVGYLVTFCFMIPVHTACIKLVIRNLSSYYIGHKYTSFRTDSCSTRVKVN